jgi:SAM-dependent methyltransferase
MRPKSDGWSGDDYEARFDALASSGVDVHGEADFVMSLHPASVLDAGCGTGRVARELARRGVDVVGVDADHSMIATARRLAPDISWQVADVAHLDLDRVFDVVVMAGNVPLFTPASSHAALIAGCARHLAPGGELVCGFQLGHGYELSHHEGYCSASGLDPSARWSTWKRDPFTDGGTYVVSVHLRRSLRAN